MHNSKDIHNKNKAKANKRPAVRLDTWLKKPKIWPDKLDNSSNNESDSNDSVLIAINNNDSASGNISDDRSDSFINDTTNNILSPSKCVEVSERSDSNKECVEAKGQATNNKSDNSRDSQDTNFPTTAIQPKQLKPCTIGNRSYQFNVNWYSQFPWLHYDQNLEGMVCFLCCKAVHMKMIPCSSKIEPAFTTVGFKSWNKGKDRFEKHQSSALHMHAIQKVNGFNTTNVGTMLSEVQKESQAIARKGLKTIISTVKFLARQGLALRGHQEEEGNFQQLLKTRTEDIPEMRQWLSRSKPLTSKDIQNEILQLLSHNILRKIMNKIQQSNAFSIMVDETTDSGCLEQVSFFIRYVENLRPHEVFLGLYETANTTGQHLHSIILDVITRFGLDINKLRGQCYDGAANMKGQFKGVQARIQAIQPLAIYIHCFNHSLNLAVQDASKTVPIIRDSLSIVNEIGVLIKSSPARFSMFKELKAETENVGYNPRPLCPTRWVVHTKSLMAVIQNYEVLIDLLEQLYSKKSDESAAKAKGLHSQLEKADILFGIMVAKFIFEVTERLSEVLQCPKVTVCGALEAVSLVVASLKEKRTDKEFDQLWNEMGTKAKELDLIEPQVPRKRNPPKRVQYTENPSDATVFLCAKDLKRKEYFEAIDNVLGEIDSRFNQPGILNIAKVERVLLSSVGLNQSTFESDIIQVCELYSWDKSKLGNELCMFKQLIKSTTKSTYDIVHLFMSLQTETRQLFPEMEKLLQLILVIPFSAANCERSFSMLRRIKTYLRSTMKQTRLNHCVIANAYKEELDKISEEEIMVDFVNNSQRKFTFGEIKIIN